jgi:RNA polymerase sigma-70 factor, ECF subfamily
MAKAYQPPTVLEARHSRSARGDSLVTLDSDTALMARVMEGDLAAFEQLVDKYKQPIINFLSRTLGDPTEAEDLAQNVFVQVYKSASRYQLPAKFSTWLFTIARNLCLNEFRRRSRHRADSLDHGASEVNESSYPQLEDARLTLAPEALLHSELVQKVEEALAGLPDPQRTAILLLREEDMSYEAIAAVLGTSLPATKSLIHRGRAKLKQSLLPYLRTGAWGPAQRFRPAVCFAN